MLPTCCPSHRFLLTLARARRLQQNQPDLYTCTWWCRLYQPSVKLTMQLLRSRGTCWDWHQDARLLAGCMLGLAQPKQLNQLKGSMCCHTACFKPLCQLLLSR
jgi:hypothetical protein